MAQNRVCAEEISSSGSANNKKVHKKTSQTKQQIIFTRSLF